MRNALPFGLVLALGACGTAPPPPYNVPPASPVNVAFACEDGQEVVVRYFGDGRATIRLSPDRAVQLAAQEAASGARYAGEDVVFWTEGRDGVLQVAGEETRCEQMRTD